MPSMKRAKLTDKMINLVPRISVPLNQRSENKSSGNNHFEITKEITEFCPSGFTQPAPMARMPEMVAPRARIPAAGQKNRGLCGLRRRNKTKWSMDGIVTDKSYQSASVCRKATKNMILVSL